uniref:von Willebrand factor A domain-containing protein 7-like n=1 Tax=Scatophagus argus TaxID=75038 RepID=UPI001ED8321A|nr:von Willebrand factor A domain-containing protein 7-like [Scatophagus argus]XP_046264811.1 von Willebrand factor A domain-containing protein 7-like [Scatophagus argus]XP_046264819.1 von Willebrand factor A domain-containing protein 7-like [Scatophagus argus]
MPARQTAMFLVAVVLPGLIHCFQPFFAVDETSITHRDITRRAVLRKIAEVCRDIAASEGRDFSLIINDNLSVAQVQKACSSSPTSTSPLSTDMLQTAIDEIYYSNGNVDSSLALRVEYHFDDETFQEGRNIITAGVSSVKANVKLGNVDAGRQTLGQVCHTLQDFYSHSNWVELGKTTPYSTLIKPDEPLENLAGPETPTCRSCTGTTCTDNILPEVLSQGLLTSGYFNIRSSAKPAGKCSHGGFFDKTSKKDPVGGINKDAVESDHGSLHNKAANLAVDATMELLEDIRVAVGDKDFLRLMGLSQSSVLCFVIDTTGSMSDDIAEAKRVSFDIIDRKRGTPQEPSAYILVPFNDPDFGPVIKTTDADIFKDHISRIIPNGGGDNPELCLSGLRLALTAAPRSSEIFVFTDAPAKDFHLKSTVTALIENTKSQVNFMLTDVLSSRRRRSDLQSFASRILSQSDTQLYRDLARSSGGQAIEVTKSDLSLATSVIEDSSASAVVTVFQVVMNPGRPDNFTFIADASVSNMIIYITGASSLTFRLTSSTGVSQSSSQSSGPLASFTTVGNLRRLSLNITDQTGLWEISVNSNSPYSVKVIGQSSVNFVYNLVEAHEGAHSGFSLQSGRPPTGGNITLLVTVTGSDTVTVTEITLFDSSGSREINGSLQSLGSGNFLVRFSAVPAGDYVVQLRGQDSSSSSRSTPSSFQRQASTQIKTSSVSVTAQADNINIEPGSTISIPFTVSSDSAGTFSVTVNNDRSFSSTSPSTVVITAESGGKANGTVTLTTPASTASGTDVTLTIEAQNAAGTDTNYAVLRLSVTAKVTDLTSPVCQVVNISGICPASSSLCALSQWEFTANLTDGVNGTGIESITIRQGNGILNTSTVVGTGGENITLATYSASCCSQTVVLAAVDKTGNVGTCVGQARALTTLAPVTNTTPITTTMTTTDPVTATTPMTTAAVGTTSTGGHTLTISHFLWISVVVSILWQ